MHARDHRPEWVDWVGVVGRPRPAAKRHSDCQCPHGVVDEITFVDVKLRHDRNTRKNKAGQTHGAAGSVTHSRRVAMEPFDVAVDPDIRCEFRLYGASELIDRVEETLCRNDRLSQDNRHANGLG